MLLGTACNEAPTLPGVGGREDGGYLKQAAKRVMLLAIIATVLQSRRGEYWKTCIHNLNNDGLMVKDSKIC